MAWKNSKTAREYCRKWQRAYRCTPRYRKYQRAYYKRNRTRYAKYQKKYRESASYRIWLSKYRRTHHAQLAKNRDRWRAKNWERENKMACERRRLIRPQLRQKVISHYGGKCRCCGETYLEFLAIDHIAKNGAEHRKQIRTGDLYTWLRSRNFPKGFRVLCHNCNFASFRGICPHKRKKGQRSLVSPTAGISS